jgi:hypothetical protein
MAANYTFLRTIADRVIVWLHGRRLGLFGDGQASVNNSLVVDGITVGSTRTGANSLKQFVAGNNGAGAVTVTGTIVGDVVELVCNITDGTDVTSSFEATVTVANQVQQTSASNLSAKNLLFFVNPQAAA